MSGVAVAADNSRFFNTSSGNDFFSQRTKRTFSKTKTFISSSQSLELSSIVATLSNSTSVSRKHCLHTNISDKNFIELSLGFSRMSSDVNRLAIFRNPFLHNSRNNESSKQLRSTTFV